MDSGTREGTPADGLARLSNNGTELNPTSAQPRDRVPSSRRPEWAGVGGGTGGGGGGGGAMASGMGGGGSGDPSLGGRQVGAGLNSGGLNSQSAGREPQYWGSSACSARGMARASARRPQWRRRRAEMATAERRPTK